MSAAGRPPYFWKIIADWAFQAEAADRWMLADSSGQQTELTSQGPPPEVGS